MNSSTPHPTTPDGRYFVHNGRLWRCTNPNLDEAERKRLVAQLMNARREVKSAKKAADENAIVQARQRIHQAKIALGERGPTWWHDDPDYNRRLVKNTPYADWWHRRG